MACASQRKRSIGKIGDDTLYATPSIKRISIPWRLRICHNRPLYNTDGMGFSEYAFLGFSIWCNFGIE
jgi:hypothetical protein